MFMAAGGVFSCQSLLHSRHTVTTSFIVSFYGNTDFLRGGAFFEQRVLFRVAASCIATFIHDVDVNSVITRRVAPVCLKEVAQRGGSAGIFDPS